MLKAAAKSAARIVATVLVAPEWLSFQMRAMCLGADRALEGSTQLLSLLPGLGGAYLRTAFLRTTLAECDPTARVEFGTIFSKVRARLGKHCYIGPRCCIGWAHIEEDVLIAAGVHIPSGAHIHGTCDSQTLIREQAGTIEVVHIGAGTWIGANAVIMADIGRNCVIGAGAVVTRPLPDNVVAAGVPARVIRSRIAVSEDTPIEADELLAVASGAPS